MAYKWLIYIFFMLFSWLINSIVKHHTDKTILDLYFRTLKSFLLLQEINGEPLASSLGAPSFIRNL